MCRALPKTAADLRTEFRKRIKLRTASSVRRLALRGLDLVDDPDNCDVEVAFADVASCEHTIRVEVWDGLDDSLLEPRILNTVRLSLDGNLIFTTREDDSGEYDFDDLDTDTLVGICGVLDNAAANTTTRDH